ncbi:MAG TPA: polysaccharide deacetylase family protein [Polyangiaceae bacterium]|nr:polysaccharide deacetylase family protein [Polyangiaceae bacterium]
MLATLYVACADPAKKVNKGSGGAPGSAGMEVGDAGQSETGGSHAMGGSHATGGMSDAGEGGMAEGGEAGASEATGGKGGSGGAAQGGSGGMAPDPCTLTTVGGPSRIPPAPTTGVPKPAGAVGNLMVINWAGFKGAISYTFDDALQTQLAHYNELNAVGVPMTFYLVCSKALNDQAWTKAATDGHELGNHTMHHCTADGKTCDFGGPFVDVATELDACTAQIKANFGVDAYTLAAPRGDGGYTEPATSRFLLNRGVYDDPAGVVPNSAANPWTLPCHIAAMGETAEMANGYNSVSDDVRVKGTWRIILSHSLEMDGTYNPVLASEVVKAMTYTKSLGDVWADTMLKVGSYWRAQKLISGVQPKSVGSDNVYSWTLPAHFPPGQYVRAKVSGGKVKQCGTELTWDDHGYYEINLDAGSVTVSP